MTAKANADKIIIGKFYDGIDDGSWFTETTRMATVEDKRYLATTYSDQVAYIGEKTTKYLYNVGNAGVRDLNDQLVINSLADLNSASSLYNNVGIAVSCVLTPDVARTVNYIFVNFGETY